MVIKLYLQFQNIHAVKQKGLRSIITDLPCKVSNVLLGLVQQQLYTCIENDLNIKSLLQRSQNSTLVNMFFLNCGFFVCLNYFFSDLNSLSFSSGTFLFLLRLALI